MGIESTHVDDEGSFLVRFGLDKNFSIGQPRVDGHKVCCKESIKHGLNKGAVGWLLGWSAGISKK